MFKKCLLVSIVLHIVFIIGAGFYPSHSASQITPPYFQLVSSVVSETAGVRGQNGEKGSFFANKSENRGRIKSQNPAMKVLNSVQSAEKETKVNITEGLSEDSTIRTSQTKVGEQFSPSTSDGAVTGNGSADSEAGNGSGGSFGAAVGSGVSGTSQSAISKKAPSRTYYLEPSYPEQARQKGWEGTVVLEAKLGKDGRIIGEIRLVQPSGYKVLDDAAKKAMKKWRYQPATQDGEPIDWTLRIRIPFKLED
jgi:TonB family protein